MLLGLPQMQGRELDVLTVPLVLDLSGPGGDRWLLTPADTSTPIRISAVCEDGMADTTVVRSSTPDFVRWATRRAPWREFTDITGRRDAVEPFLDRLNII